MSSISSFEEIIRDGAVYVDKTEPIFRSFLKNADKYHFLVRPRRFGKSLLCSTLANLFLGDEKLFQGLWIHGKWDFDKEKRYVIHIDMSIHPISESVKVFRRSVNDLLIDLAANLNIEIKIDLEDPPSIGLRKLLNLAHLKSGKQVVVIIDEYDKQILDIVENIDLREQIRVELQSFYGILKGSSSNIRLVFITGMLKFSQTSMFSTLNNLIDHSLRYDCGTICGYTEVELKSYFSETIRYLSDIKKVSPNDLFKDLKLKYNGYSFGIGECDTSETVYNPFQINSAFSLLDLETDFWSFSGSAELIYKVVQETGALLTGPKLTTLKTLRQSVQSIDNLSLEVLMFYGGYLTLKSYDKATGSILLGVPNNQVRSILNDDLLLLLFKTNQITDTTSVIDLSNKLSSIISPKNFSVADTRILEELFNQAIANTPYENLKTEDAFRNILDTILSMKFEDIRKETQSSRGRSDTIIRVQNSKGKVDKILIIEYKIEKKKKKSKNSGFSKATEKALDQIKQKGYDEPLRVYGVPIFGIGVVLTGEKKIHVLVEKLN